MVVTLLYKRHSFQEHDLSASSHGSNIQSSLDSFCHAGIHDPAAQWKHCIRAQSDCTEEFAASHASLIDNAQGGVTRLAHQEFLHDVPTGEETLGPFCCTHSLCWVIVGTTPQRRDFVYSRQFTRTKPHSELLEQCDIKESDTEVNCWGCHMVLYWVVTVCLTPDP